MEDKIVDIRISEINEIIEQAFDIGCICLHKRACEEGIISDNEKFEELLHKCIETGKKGVSNNGPW